MSIQDYPTYKLKEFVFIRKTDENYLQNLVKSWMKSDTGVSSLSISLKCPITMSRLVLPCRGEDCTHIQCFDGHTFVKMNEKTFGKWLCNICWKPATLNKLYVDGLILEILNTVSRDVEDIFFDENGNWSDATQDKNDHSVIDLSETLEVIDLTGSDTDDESETEKTDNKGTPEAEKKDNFTEKDKITKDKSQDKNSDKSENKENMEYKEPGDIPNVNTNKIMDKHVNKRSRAIPYSQNNPNRRYGPQKTWTRSQFEQRRPLRQCNHTNVQLEKNITYITNTVNQAMNMGLVVGAQSYNPLCANGEKLNIYFHSLFNVVN